MRKMALLIFALVSMFSVLCLDSYFLKKMKPFFPTLEKIPKGAYELVTNLQSKGEVYTGVIEQSNITDLMERHNLPDLVKESIGLSKPGSLFSISHFVAPLTEAVYENVIGAFTNHNGKVRYAIIYGKASGTIEREMYQKRCYHRKCEAPFVTVAEQLPLEKYEKILGLISAKGIEAFLEAANKSANFLAEIEED